MAHAHRPTGFLGRFSPRRAWSGVLGFVDAHDLGQAIGVVAVLVGVGGMIVLAALLGGDEPAPPRAEVPPPEVASTPAPSPFVNETADYAFMVPETWDVRSDGHDTRAVSPTGRIKVTFGRGSSGGIRAASARLLESLLETQRDQELIGSTWESIGGARSLLVSGTAEESGRRVRFLAIAVPGDPRTYAITIVVPASADPERMLPRLERLVTSFEIVDPTPLPAR